MNIFEILPPGYSLEDPCLLIGTGRYKGQSGRWFERHGRAQLRKLYSKFTPSISQESRGLSHVWVRNPVTEAIDGTSTRKAQSPLYGVEVDGHAPVQLRNNTVCNAQLFDFKHWKAEGAMDLTALEDQSAQFGRIRSVMTQYYRQRLAAASIRLYSGVPTDVKWCFYSTSLARLWRTCMVQPHEVTTLLVGSSSISWRNYYRSCGCLPEEIHNLYARPIAQFLKVIEKQFQIVKPGSGCRTLDSLLEEMQAVRFRIEVLR